MVRCINCSVAIPVTQQYQYNAIYMGPDILSVLEERIDRQVINEDFLCQECVNLLIVEANNRNEGQTGKQQDGHQSVCIGCGTSIARKSARHTRVILINQGNPVWNCFADTIGPTEVINEDFLCQECVNLLIVEANNRNEGQTGKQQDGHQSVCISCGTSIARKSARHTRVILINQGNPVWNCFADTIGPTEIPSNAQVCLPCWLKAHRQRPSAERSQTQLIAPLSTASNEIEDTDELAPVISAASPSYDGKDSDNGRTSSDSENCDYPESVNLKVCRICLAMDTKLYPIRKYKLDKAYENLTGSRVSEEDKLPQKLCYECAQRLINCSRFRTKSLRAMTLMMQIVKNQDHLTIRSLKSLSSINKQFASPLATRYFAPNHYDYLLEDSSKKDDSVQKNNIELLEQFDSVIDTDRSKKNDAVQNNNIEFVEEFDSIIDTEDNLNGSMDSSDDNGSLGVDKRKKIAKENPKRERNKLSKEENSVIVKCLKTFDEQAKYDGHLASREEVTVPNTLLPKYRKTDNGYSDAEIIIDTEKENNNIDKNSKVRDALDVKVEDSLTEEHLKLEIDYTTDDSTVLEVKKKKKETKEVTKRPQDDTELNRSINRYLVSNSEVKDACDVKDVDPLNVEDLESQIDYTTDECAVPEVKKIKRETKEVRKRPQKYIELNRNINRYLVIKSEVKDALDVKNEDPLNVEYLESQIDYTTDDSTVPEFKKRKKETKEVRKRPQKDTKTKRNNDSNLVINSEVKDALDVKNEDPLTEEKLELEIDYTTDESAGPEVKKGKKDTKEVRKKAQKDTEPKDEVPLNKEFLETGIDYTTDDSTVPELKKRKRETKKVSKRTQKDTETKDEDPLKEEYLESQKDYSTDDSIVKEVKKRKKETKEVRTRTKTEPKRNIGEKLIATLNKMLFDVTELTFEEQVAEIEKRKESSNYKNALFRCEECYKGYLDEKAYDFHMLKHTNECGEHRCAVCKSHFKRAFLLRKHATDHHTYRFSCKRCPYVTAYKHNACLHGRWHEGTKYSCPHCPGEFLKLSTYMGHIRIKHPSDFVCQLCGFSFVSEKGKHQHLKLKHRMENALIPPDGPLCELCDIRFISSEALKQHMSVSAKHHSSDKAAIKPNQPKYRTKTKDNIKRAIDRFGKEYEINKSQVDPIRNEVIPCEKCGVQLEGSRAYHSHFRQMHPGENRTNYPSMKSPRMCEVCGRIFQSKTQLEDHRGSHTGEQFKCELCGQSFSMKQRLLGHFRRRHSDNNATYPCPTCGKHFSSAGNMKRHMVIHTGLKPFKCEMCGKTFKQKTEKQSHISYVHLKKPWQKRSRKRDKKVSMQPPANTPTAHV